MKQLWIGGFLALTLSACGVVYHAPAVPDDDPNVDVIAITASSVSQANSSQYTPKTLPAIFFQTAHDGRVNDIVEARTTALPMRLPPEIPQTSYEIGVGDVVILAAPTAGTTVEQLSGLLAAQNRRQGYTVQDDGAIAIPDVGRVNLAGLTLQGAEDALFQRLVSSQIEPSFSLEIAEFNSQYVSVGGAVARPAGVPVTITGMTLNLALTAAGGIQAPNRDEASIHIHRNGQQYFIPYTEYLKRPNVQNLRLAHGDSIFVDAGLAAEQAQEIDALKTQVDLRRAALQEARNNFQTLLENDALDRDHVYVAGEVGQAGRWPLPLGARANLADALFENGGFDSETANPRQIYVLRGTAQSEKMQAWQLDVRNATNLVLATRFELRPNDVIFVSERPVTSWSRVVNQITPTLINTAVAATQ